MCRSQDLRAVALPPSLSFFSFARPTALCPPQCGHFLRPGLARLFADHWMDGEPQLPALHHTHQRQPARDGATRPTDADEADPARFTLIVSHVDPNADGTFRGNWIQTLILSLSYQTGGTSRARCAFAGSRPVADAELPHPLAEVVRTGSLYRCSVAKLRGCGGKAE